MNIKKKQLLVILMSSFLLSVLSVILIILKFGVFYEEYQGLFHSFLSGAFSPGTPFYSWYYQGYIGISYIYSYLYQYVPQIEWLSWISFFYIVLSSTIILSLFILLFRKSTSIYLLILLQLMLCFLILSDQVINLQNARVSFLLCGASLLAIVILFNNVEKIKQNTGWFIMLNLIFLLGSLTRSEPALAISLLLFCFAVVWHKNIKNALIITSPALIITASVIIGIMIDIRTSNEFHKQVEPDIEMQFTVRGNVIPISEMTNKRDSMRYEAAIEMLWGDPDVVTVEFMRSLIKDPPYTSQSSEQWDRTVAELEAYCLKYIHLIIFNLIIIFAVSGLLFYRKKPLEATLVILYLAGFFIAVTAQIYLVKMKDWSFSPYVIIFMASNLFLFLKVTEGSKLKVPFVTVLLAGVFIAQFGFVQKSADANDAKFQYNRAIYATVHDIAKGETLLINPTSFQSFTAATPPFTPFNFSDFDKLYFFESQIASVLPTYRYYLEKECNCNVWNFSNFFRYLLSDDYPRKVYVLSAEQRMDLISRYVKVIHDLEITYSKVNNVHLPVSYGDMNQLHLYLLDKKSLDRGNEKEFAKGL